MRVGGLLMARSGTEALVSGQPVVLALQKLREEIDQIDEQVGRKPRLGAAEGLTLLSSAALAAASPVVWSEKVVEVLIPGCSLLVAAIGVSAEYVGRTATASGKEIAARSLRTAMESEALLASAERSKSVLPLTVGASAAAAAFSLVVPSFLARLSSSGVVQAELLLVCPAIALAAATVAALSQVECFSWADAARAMGRRRFATRSSWQSQRDSVYLGESREKSRLNSFLWGILPAPIIALLIPGAIQFKAIVATNVAAAQAAYYFASAEAAVARATAAVALRGRTAAVAETYASQASRVSALLPFTSALIGLCAAFSAIFVEVQPVASTVFPALGALVAAAAQVSKACCEADAEAAKSASDALKANEATSPDFGNDPPLPLLPAILDFLRPILPINKQPSYPAPAA